MVFFLYCKHSATIFFEMLVGIMAKCRLSDVFAADYFFKPVASNHTSAIS
ncbi:hypothetical protein TFKS16_0281 [Tannerella forsythia KS16]|uniref:Uncharacterized protein n=1 Tax=Tannerella forsythia (strain ATCC 43037 / JCM 10827 / CCUG 21028 A / KCTC 5666 / FDC 338) TaxID=203275 RepID=G8UJL4_TANFA|nr:hypothetical protein BFO_0292 [Tannerella forsythia 92A2]BAR47844.1 hypothetical protein TF3313_0249 [Tannerella forsythia 3313]BAR50612.1 hypothetical protein TFKS16_0281 [Tannerella forsythia KS16]